MLAHPGDKNAKGCHTQGSGTHCHDNSIDQSQLKLEDVQTECNPNYEGCVPMVDVDCEGGSGDGPLYQKGPVKVKKGGKDVYRLDGDGNGTGCDVN